MYENFVEEIDAIDNGVSQTEEKPRYFHCIFEAWEILGTFVPHFVDFSDEIICTHFQEVHNVTFLCLIV